MSVIHFHKGVHPHDAKTWEEDTSVILKEIASNSECVAMGECGLDFNRNFSPPEVQLEVCEKQVSDIKMVSDVNNYIRKLHMHDVYLLSILKYSDTDSV